MKRKSTINLVGGTFTLAMSLVIASVCQCAWADDMTQPVAAAAGQAPDAIALQAIFMDVQGKVRWRINENAPWTEAKVNDLLNAGAEIRTGLKSRSTLRVGKNATILVDSGTTFQLPEMVQEGQTLRTLATVKSGRADFKVDHVGFANDFKVVTPQTTLSVRGTGFALASGPLKGVDISGANNNTINAIEVTYIAANIAYFVSGQGKTSSESGRQDPVQNAWVSTIGPPPIAGTMVSQSDVQQQVAQGTAGVNPSSNTQQIQQTQAGEANENAIDTALVLASDSGGGGGDSGDAYSHFKYFADQNVQYAKIRSTDIQTIAFASVSSAGFAQNELADGSVNKEKIDDKLLIMKQQVDFMAAKNGDSYVGGSEGRTLMTMAGFAFKSNADRIASNKFKIDFDKLFRNGAGQDALIADLSGLRTLSFLYSGDNYDSILNQADRLYGEIGAHYDNAQTANRAITGLTQTYTANMATANSQASQANAGFSQQFANSRAIANQYLNDFKTIVGSNNSDAARTALAAVTALVGDQIRYVDQAEAAVNAAEAASRKAHSRGEMVYMKAVATQIGRATTIQLAAGAAMRNIDINAEAIHNNYSNAQEKFDSLRGSSSSNNN